jgi:hypothetical protein
MSWFITAICSDECLSKLHLELNDPAYERPQRTFGFFDRYHEAFLAIKDNTGNMHEYLYDYIVLEYIEPGIHPKVHSVELYKWSNLLNRWIYADKTNVPELKLLTNFALG